MTFENSLDCALSLDKKYPSFKSDFVIPFQGKCIYLCGNSLGLLPKNNALLLSQELEAWGQYGVLAHFDHPHKRPWVSIDEEIAASCAKIVGLFFIDKRCSCKRSCNYEFIDRKLAFANDTLL